MLGRVTTGSGGGVIEARASRVIDVEAEDPTWRLTFHRASKGDKRHGQAVAVASLPETAA